MMHSLLSVLFFITGITGLTVAVILICRKENVGKNVFLSLCLFSLAAGCIYNLSLSEDKIYNLPHISGIIKAFAFLVAPCAFLYVRNMLNNTTKLKGYDGLHFIPFFIMLAGMMVNVSQQLPATDTTNFWSVDFLANPKYAYVLNVFKTTIWLLYAYTQTLLIIQLENEKKYNPKMLQWLKLFSFGTMILFTSLIIQTILNISFIKLDIVDNLIASFILVSSAVFLFFKPHIVFEMEEQPEETVFFDKVPEKVEEKDNVRKLNTPILSKEKMQSYIEALNTALYTHEPFLQQGFVIRDLSELTGIPIHHLSYIINTEYNMHFQDFTNQKRIDYLKAKINEKEWKNLSLEGMAWAVGFKSRSTFFRAFIKLTGQSPSDYFNNEKNKKNINYTAIA